jgi:hypothetical protein
MSTKHAESNGQDVMALIAEMEEQNQLTQRSQSGIMEFMRTIMTQGCKAGADGKYTIGQWKKVCEQALYRKKLGAGEIEEGTKVEINWPAINGVVKKGKVLPFELNAEGKVQLRKVTKAKGKNPS